jgi:hypothetical protein
MSKTTASIAIERGVPLPLAKGRTKTGLAAALSAMQVGDSIFLGCNLKSTVHTQVCTYGQRHGRTFTVRTVEGGKRIWRTA